MGEDKGYAQPVDNPLKNSGWGGLDGGWGAPVRGGYGGRYLALCTLARLLWAGPAGMMPKTEGTLLSMWMTPSSSRRREASLARFFFPVSETPAENAEFYPTYQGILIQCCGSGSNNTSTGTGTGTFHNIREKIDLL